MATRVIAVFENVVAAICVSPAQEDEPLVPGPQREGVKGLLGFAHADFGRIDGRTEDERPREAVIQQDAENPNGETTVPRDPRPESP
jgi:hypothetical protein